jgi:hypothetical protein
MSPSMSLCSRRVPYPRLWSASLLAATLLLPAVRVMAQDFPGEPATAAATGPSSAYDEAIDGALGEFELGNYPEARAGFLRAHKLFPNARTHRALGMVEYELKNYADATQELALALASEEMPLEGRARAETEGLLASANNYVARLKLDLSPSTTRVWVDGSEASVSTAGTLVLGVGDYELEFRAPDRASEKRRLKVTGGEAETLHVVLAPVPKRQAGSEPKQARPLRRNPWLWGALTVVAAGAAAGTAMALTAEERRGDPQYYGGSTGQTLSGP